MSSADAPQDETIEIPEDATVVKQVTWAWLWSSTPWLALVLLLVEIGWLPDPITALPLVVIIVVPRYFSWRRSAFILSDDILFYQRGGILKTSTYPISWARLTDVRARYGKFGRALGYQAVDILFDNGRMVSLTYVPLPAGLGDRIRERIDAFASEREQAPGSDSPTDGSASDEPDESLSDKPPAG